MAAIEEPAALPPRRDKYQLQEVMLLLGWTDKTVNGRLEKGDLKLADASGGRGKWFDGESVERERRKLLASLGAVDARPDEDGAAQARAVETAPTVLRSDYENLRRQLETAQSTGRRAMEMLRISEAGMDLAFLPEDPQLIVEARIARDGGGDGHG